MLHILSNLQHDFFSLKIKKTYVHCKLCVLYKEGLINGVGARMPEGAGDVFGSVVMQCKAADFTFEVRLDGGFLAGSE